MWNVRGSKNVILMMTLAGVIIISQTFQIGILTGLMLNILVILVIFV